MHYSLLVTACLLGQEAIPVEEWEIVEPAQMSYLQWMFTSLGPFYSLAIPGSAIAVFVGACLVVGISRRPSVIASYLLFLPLPLLIGMIASVHGMIMSLQVIATAGTSPKPSDIAAGIGMSLFASLLSLLLTFPSYLVLAFGLFLRTIAAGRRDSTT